MSTWRRYYHNRLVGDLHIDKMSKDKKILFLRVYLCILASIWIEMQGDADEFVDLYIRRSALYFTMVLSSHPLLCPRNNGIIFSIKTFPNHTSMKYHVTQSILYQCSYILSYFLSYFFSLCYVLFPRPEYAPSLCLSCSIAQQQNA